MNCLVGLMLGPVTECSWGNGAAENSETGIRLRNAHRCPVTTVSRRTRTKAPGCLDSCPPWLCTAWVLGREGWRPGQCCWAVLVRSRPPPRGHLGTASSLHRAQLHSPRTPATLMQRLPAPPHSEPAPPACSPSLSPPACLPPAPEPAPPACPRLPAPHPRPRLPDQQIQERWRLARGQVTSLPMKLMTLRKKL